ARAAASAQRAKRVESSTNVSAEPTWISSGRTPLTSAYRGETRGSFLFTPAGRYASTNSLRYALWIIGSTASFVASVEPDSVRSVHGDTSHAHAGSSSRASRS